MRKDWGDLSNRNEIVFRFGFVRLGWLDFADVGGKVETGIFLASIPVRKFVRAAEMFPQKTQNRN